MKKTILITRPRDQAQRIVSHLEENDFNVVVEPTFRVQKANKEYLESLSKRKVEAIILTSGNAAEVAFDAIDIFGLTKDVKVFAVGKKTAEIFLNNGFENVCIAENSSAEDLKNLILADEELMQKKFPELLYFCGEFVTLDFKRELEIHGLRVEKIPSYRIVEERSFSAEFLNQIKQNLHFDFVLLYSKNSARHFCELVKKHNLLEYFQSSKILCFSEKILFSLRNQGFDNCATFAEIPLLKKFYD